jgi:hypothetical protein
MSNDSCRHFIPVNKSCPWCKREGQKSFPIVKAFQFYQGHFAEFTNAMAEADAHGPVAIVIVVKDANGQSYMYKKGPEEMQIDLLDSVKETIVPSSRKVETCFASKFVNGLEKLFS